MKAATNPTAVNYQKKLEMLGIGAQVVEFDQTTRTAADAAAAIGCKLGQIVKSLVFRAAKSGRVVIVLTSGPNRVDEKIIRNLLGEKLGKADADFVRKATGYAIGGVPPLGHAEDIPLFIDKDLLDFETIWAAAGTPNAVFELKPSELAKVSGGKVVKVN